MQPDILFLIIITVLLGALILAIEARHNLLHPVVLLFIVEAALELRAQVILDVSFSGYFAPSAPDQNLRARRPPSHCLAVKCSLLSVSQQLLA